MDQVSYGPFELLEELIQASESAGEVVDSEVYVSKALELLALMDYNSGTHRRGFRDSEAADEVGGSDV